MNGWTEELERRVDLLIDGALSLERFAEWYREAESAYQQMPVADYFVEHNNGDWRYQ